MYELRGALVRMRTLQLGDHLLPACRGLRPIGRKAPLLKLGKTVIMGETLGALSIEYFHRSTEPLDVGAILRPRGLLNNDLEIERMFEDARPARLLSRFNAVFMTADVRSRLNGVHGNHIYRVAPAGLIGMHDNVWYGEVQKAGLKRKHNSPLLAGYPEWKPDVLAAFVQRYWSGEPSTAPNWEYLASSAEVLNLVEGPA